MFNTYLPNIYLFLKMMFGSFQQLMNKYEKYISCCGFVLITQWFSNFNNFKNIKKKYFGLNFYKLFCAKHQS